MKDNSIKAGELRLNNYIMYDGVARQIAAIREDEIDFFNEKDKCTWTVKLSKCEPIPLTKEVLEKCGFEKHDDGNMWIWEAPKDTKGGELVPVYAMHEVFYLRRYLLPDNQYCFAYNDYRSYPISYAHQLMNLFYSLTGKELEITL